jgi:hypothetical protein
MSETKFSPPFKTATNYSIHVPSSKEFIDRLLERSKVEGIRFDKFIIKILKEYLDEKKTTDIHPER